MKSFISLLRGINVSGHNMIKMAELKTLYESIGLTDVSTYIQSGNVVFRSEQNDPSVLGALIERAIQKRFGSSVTVIIRRPAELAKIIKTNPFLGLNKVDEARLYVTFLQTKPTATLVEALGPVAAKTPDEYRIIANEVYLHCPNGYGKTVLSNTFFEKHLNLKATTRNWNTVNRLLAMVGSVSG
jgi:uncharacterized protein (DUF1697 family)